MISQTAEIYAHPALLAQPEQMRAVQQRTGRVGIIIGNRVQLYSVEAVRIARATMARQQTPTGPDAA